MGFSPPQSYVDLCFFHNWAHFTYNGLPAANANSEQEGSGIISNAIANAEKLRPQGQENVSLLQQHSTATKSTPASTQFTFTCDSQVPGTIQWPGEYILHSRDPDLLT